MSFFLDGSKNGIPTTNTYLRNDYYALACFDPTAYQYGTTAYDINNHGNYVRIDNAIREIFYYDGSRNNPINLNKKISFSLWYYAKQGDARPRIFDMNYGLFLLRTDYINFFMGTNTGVQSYNNASSINSKWHHIVWAIENELVATSLGSKHKIYIDGVLDTTISNSQNSRFGGNQTYAKPIFEGVGDINAEGYTIGHEISNAQGGKGWHMPGYVADFRIYTKALTATDAAGIYSGVADYYV